ncbi:MAG: branched-chain amino acid ABC transporter permease [Halanaerobiales bacterium]|nr:branched-chain amino acid ABC transporter permease [Halanaerobiales bacterium]
MKKNLFIVLLLIIAFTLPLYAGAYVMSVFNTILVFMALGLSWDMMLRTGQLSFGTAGFFGLGAYASVLIVANMGFNPVLSLFIGAAFSGLIAFALGFIVLRLRQIYFAITTLALTHVFSVIIRNLSGLTGGASGTQLSNAIFNGNPTKLYYMILIIALLTILMSEIFSRSRIHYAINAIRNDETTAKSSGIDVFKYLLFVFVVTSAIQGLVGAAYAQQYAFVNPESTFSLNFLLLPLAMALVGGIYSTNGPIIGALILGLISEYLKLIMPYGHLVVYGFIIVIVVLFLPQGVYTPIKNKLLKSNIVGGDNNAHT